LEHQSDEMRGRDLKQVRLKNVTATANGNNPTALSRILTTTLAIEVVQLKRMYWWPAARH
jgi:hypothetical protein